MKRIRPGVIVKRVVLAALLAVSLWFLVDAIRRQVPPMAAFIAFLAWGLLLLGAYMLVEGLIVLSRKLRQRFPKKKA